MEQYHKDPIRRIVIKILNEYQKAKQEPFGGHSIGDFFRKTIPELIYSTGVVNKKTHLIQGSVGQGNWATIPWICIFDRAITTTAQSGVYIVYLLSKDGNTLYLTLNQGCTKLGSSHSKSETIAIMQGISNEIRANINPRDFKYDDSVFLGDNLTQLGDYYQKGAVFYKKYKKGDVPSEEELQSDLSIMLKIYDEYVDYKNSGILPKPTSDEKQDDRGEMELSVENTISKIKDYIFSRGFSYEDGLIENFYLSLKTKPFVILAGTSGTGKTRLGRLFAEALGATVLNGRYKMVPVRPDWSDSTDLFGYKDLNGVFIPGAIINFVKQAESDSTNPYFLCLDEMNLARVEYYFSDFLSIMETRNLDNDRVVTDPIITDAYYGNDKNAIVRYGTIILPENLYIIGTVNMDETTFPFSKKVLDRANTIEFSFVDLMPQMHDADNSKSALNLGNSFLKTEFLFLTQCVDEFDVVEEYCSELQSINNILKKSNAHVGYRVRDEIVFYLLNNKKAGLIPGDVAMDNEILQKILPRIQGSNSSLKIMLCDLFRHCAGDYEGIQTEATDISSKMKLAAQRPDCKYKKSAMKIAFMVGRLEEDGFTSYWL